MYILWWLILLAWAVCLAATGWELLLFLHFLYFSLCPPEGLKKVRNPDRMYRSAVCYAGHGPPKSISDDTETNSKTHLLILHCHSCRPLAGQSIIHSFIHSFIYFLISSVHMPPPPSLSRPLVFFSPANTTPPPAALLIEVSALRDLAVNSWSVVVNYEWLFQVKARGSGPERTLGGKAGINYCPAHAFSGREGGGGVLAIYVSEGEWICTLRSGMIPCDFCFCLKWMI